MRYFGLVLQVTLVAAVVCLGGAILQLFRFYLSRYRKRYTVAVHINMVFFIYFFTPVVWLSAGGLLGSVPPYTILFAAAAVMLVRGAMRYVFVLSLVAIVISLVAVEWHLPQYVLLYSDKINQFVDLGISIVVALLAVSLLFFVVIKSYDTERRKAEDALSRMLKMATTDELTGLGNHKFILKQLENRIAEAKRYGKKLAVILLDLDHFKEINDFHGHITGDSILRQVGQELKDAVRASDLAGRFGGEEFLIITPETDASGALILATAFAIAFKSCVLTASPLSLTISGRHLPISMVTAPERTNLRLPGRNYAIKAKP